ncbi:hypothetical protein SODALDRAFT_301656 [Sodiomyces alkalinus F11]|uniref:T6SS Phospholipase effector Tle1-like catalytic domain-containing protein n=1 Tax=Sodiomyces alkalinus (strain CBS 110278 / VKM F-3762 / F11) TaxID=1314773 RepID=A0A3N2PKK1_SODAK|nr:hypothetical protein SODALDRAFT_301656 [Sodiomyces alkalinus F11]ROT35051.1 hypothetical protein SODALDRAFT_301656 [Sodiomyces alkalinus F11]
MSTSKPYTRRVPPATPKRLIVCCDGTWMDSLGEKSGDPQSNVTRISRILRRTCRDGTPQIIVYNAGVGSGNVLDRFTGGMFGRGLESVIREAYNFVCANYVPGDDIILIGFSRGAFTARSVADMIASIGLLTPRGLEHFHAIFEDIEHMGSARRPLDDFLYDHLPPYAGEQGEAKIRWTRYRKSIYRDWLKSLGYTRDTHPDGVTPITIKALAVWDTVGTLGVPPAPIIGLSGSNDQWKFTNTEVSDKVENAFQALALDEPRYAFRPALWERLDGNNRTRLKQVWFPGNHAGVGGGWHDQQIATISLAWMCDQLSTVGVEFSLRLTTALFMEDLAYSAVHPFPAVPSATLTFPPPHTSASSSLSSVVRSVPSLATSWLRSKAASSPSSSYPLPWGCPTVCRIPDPAWEPTRDETDHDDATCAPHPVHARPEELWRTARAWGLGQMRAPTSRLQMMAGTTVRTPGLCMRADYETNRDTDDPLRNTGERIHSSVRVRLACEGLGLDDRARWSCEALTREAAGRGSGPVWRLERRRGLDPREEEAAVEGFVPRELALGYPEECLYPVDRRDVRWRWVYEGDISYVGDEGDERYAHLTVPQSMILPEEPLVGYWERYFLSLTAGYADVWRYAQRYPPMGAKGRGEPRGEPRGGPREE